MAAGKFIKENFVLITGIVVPVLLVAVFLATAMTAKKMTKPPAYDLLMMVNNYGAEQHSPYNTYIQVENGKVYIRLERKKTEYTGSFPPRIFRYSAATGKLREIPYTLPETEEETYKAILPETAGLQLDKNDTAPDGFTFTRGRYRGGMDFPFFFGGSSPSGPQIQKNGAVYNLNQTDSDTTPDKYSFYNSQHLGWIIPAGGAQ